MPLQIRRGTNAERLTMTVPLAQGEPLYVTDDQRLYIGNGSTLGGVQITGFTAEDAQDASASMFTNGAHSGITFTYGLSQDGSNKIDATVDLSGYTGIIAADAFKGSIFGDDSSLLVDAVAGRIVGPVFANVTGNVSGNVTGNVTGNLSGNVTGNLTGNTTGYHTGDVKGSVFADDSTVIVDSVSSRLSANTLNIDKISISTNTITSNSLTGYGGGYGINVGNTNPDFGTTLKFVQPASTASLYIKNYADTMNNVSKIVFEGFKGTINSPVSVSAGDHIGGISFGATEPVSGNGLPSVMLSAMVDPTGTINNEVANGKINILTGGGTSAGTFAINYLTFDSKGQLAVNQENAQATLDVNGFAKLAVLTAAPTSPSDGMIAIADGSSWDPAGTGKSVMVVYLGGGWRVSATAP